MNKHDAASFRPLPAASSVPSGAYRYRFYLSFCLMLLVVFSFGMNNSPLGIFILTLVSLVFCADVLFRSALKDLRHGRLSVAVLFSYGIVSGFLFSAYDTFSEHHWHAPCSELYVYVLLFITLALWTEKRIVKERERARVFIKKIDDFLPKSARLISGKKIFSDEVKTGDVLIVKSGERIPADGVLEKGSSAIDEELITGNILPSLKKEGDRVYAGTLNKTAQIEVRVTNGLSACALMSVIDALKSGELRRSEMKNRLDGAAGWLLLSVMISSAVMALWVRKGEDFIGLFLFTSAVVCPLVLPFSVVLPSHFVRRVARKNRILLQNITSLSAIGDADVFVFDKTGTLTYGELSVSAVAPVTVRKQKALIEALVSAEQFVNSPFAAAVGEYSRQQHITPQELASFEVISGMGIRAVTNGGKEIVAGSTHWLEKQGIKLPANPPQTAQVVIGVAADNRFLGYVFFDDKLRPRVKETIDFLKKKGKEIFLVSGDNESPVASVAAEAGIEKYSFDVLPKTKAEIVTNQRTMGKQVVMVGDGFNDIIALLKADGGIVYASGKNIYNNWVDILVKRKDLYPLVYLSKINKKFRRLIYQNMVLCILVNGLIAGYWLYKMPVMTPSYTVLAGSLAVFVLLFINSIRITRTK